MRKLTFSTLTTYSLFLLLLASCQKNITGSSTGKTEPRAVTGSFKVVGYLPSYSGSVNQVQFSKLTHIIYAFLIPTSSGGYDAVDNPAKLDSMVTYAHASGVKAMISVGGGGGGGGFAGIVASSSNITTFVNNMMNFVNQYDLDGIDIDWEYPSGGTQATNFLTMMQQLGTALHNNGKILSVAVIGLDGGNYIESGMYSTIDFMTIMAYDDNNFQHSTYELATQCMAYWLGQGCPASEAVLGVPFYGHDSTLSESDPNDEPEYNTIIAEGGNPQLDVFGSIGYNGLLTMRSKTSYAMAQGGGIGIWELSGDATGSNSLLSAIYQVVQANGVVSTGAPVGQIVTFKGFNGLYVTSNDGDSSMECDRATAQAWEDFTVVDAGYGKVALEAMDHYVSSEDGNIPITCNRASYSTWEEFDWIPVPGSSTQVFLRGTNGLFISSEDGLQAMTCNRPVASGWEAFGVNQ